MTPELFKPLHNAIIWAQCCADPLLWQEALQRFDAIDRALESLAGSERLDLEERLFRMLPSDWPLWLETCRGSSVSSAPGRLLH